jgi:hypothetical protein
MNPLNTKNSNADSKLPSTSTQHPQLKLPSISISTQYSQEQIPAELRSPEAESKHSPRARSGAYELRSGAQGYRSGPQEQTPGVDPRSGAEEPEAPMPELPIGAKLFMRFDDGVWYDAEVLTSTPAETILWFPSDNSKETVVFPDSDVMLEAEYLAVHGPHRPEEKIPNPADGLPAYMGAAKPDFLWDTRNGDDICKDINEAYETIAHWRQNIFYLPSSTAGKKFVQEVTRLNWAFANKSPLESIAQKAEMVITPLLLQRPHSKSTPKEDLECLKRRFELWQSGDIASLLKEGTTIQARLKSSKPQDSDDTIARRFTQLMLSGNGKSAMTYIVNQGKGGVLKLDEATKKMLAEKHPKGEDANPGVLIEGDLPDEIDPIAFAPLHGGLIKACALKTEGAAGVSGASDRMWRKMVTSYKDTSAGLCNAVAAATRRLATEFIDPKSLAALMANRGIPLDKCPGLRPIGIGEVKRRIMGKAIMHIINEDVQTAAGPLQLCAGQSAGVEAAVHAMREFFAADETDAVLLIDADNAFNRANRKVILHNVQHICPIFKYVLINTYRVASRIFVLGGWELPSQEGTTQGCPLAMAMYALTIVPFVSQLHGLCKHAWFADDGTGAGKLKELRAWWDKLLEKGPAYGYFPKPSKTWLIVKADRLDEAKRVFEGTGVQFTSEGMRHLGAAIGSKKYKESYLQKKIDEWISNVERLAKIAVTEPQVAFSAFIQRMQSRWVFVLRTVNDVSELMQPLEDAIRQKFLPALLGREVNNLERELFSLPAKHGGLGIANPCVQSDRQFTNSEELTKPLLALVMAQERTLNARGMSYKQKKIRKFQLEEKEAGFQESLAAIKEAAPPELKIAIEHACEKGASSWVTARPLHSHPWTVLNKGQFRDAIYLRYGWEPLRLPEQCRCGARFTVAHAMQCMTGGFRGHMHNEVQYVFYDTFKQAGYKDVVWEPELQALEGETLKYKTANKDEEARSDVSVLGFWSRLRRAFFDISAFSPFALSYRGKSLSSCFAMHEKRKRREYEERIRNVEHGDFSPLIVSTTGGIGTQGSMIIKRLSATLAETRNQHPSMVTGWLRCRLSFAILRSAIVCLRGSRPLRRKVADKEDDVIDLAVSEALIQRACDY